MLGGSYPAPVIFQSTLPAWGATCGWECGRGYSNISIHAPRMGSDITGGGNGVYTDTFQSTLPAWGATVKHYPDVYNYDNFNPRSPHGERPKRSRILDERELFQSTLPAWGATLRISVSRLSLIFQSTLPAWGATSLLRSLGRSFRFQSTLPAWGATADVPCA